MAVQWYTLMNKGNGIYKEISLKCAHTHTHAVKGADSKSKVSQTQEGGSEDDLNGAVQSKEMFPDQRRIRQELKEVWPDLLFTPFLPLRSFLYCSLSFEIKLWSTSQASVKAFGSLSTWRMEIAFSLRAQTPELEPTCPVYTSKTF